MKNSFYFAFTVIGTLIGAGFATGQELLSFFAGISYDGYIYYIFSVIILLMVSFVLYMYGSKRKIYTTKILADDLFGKKISFVFSFITMVFLYLCFVVTVSGAGTLFYENIKLPYCMGVVAVIIITCIVLKNGIKGIYIMNLLMTPLIIICILLFSFLSVYFCIETSLIFKFDGIIRPFAYALIYSGYNIFSLVPIILESARRNNKKEIMFGFFISFIIILLTGIVMLIVLYKNSSIASSYSLPFLGIINADSRIMGKIYMVIMFFAMLTTAVSCYYGFLVNISGMLKSASAKTSRIWLLTAYFISLSGFTNLVRNVYFLFGIAGIFMYLFLIYKIFKHIIKN